MHSELCGQSSNFGGRKINQQGWYFNKCQVPKGHLALKNQKLVIEVNSQQRADHIKRKISRRLGKKAPFQHAVIQSTEKLLEQTAQQEGTAKTLNQMEEDLELMQQSPEIQDMLAKMKAEHWDNWLDMTLPALNNQTPRNAAKSKKGRELLEGLLLDFQYKAKENPQMAPDLAKLRRELGMD